MLSQTRLVVGLGNPGAEHAQDRHNAGFWWTGLLAQRYQITLKIEARFHASFGRSADDLLWLLQPRTYMNASGRAVAAILSFYKLVPEQVFVVHDELDLVPGDVRLKYGGGVGGHNGLKDIAAHLGARDFWRLRLGIGHPGERSQVSNYVLNAPTTQEQPLIRDAIERSIDVWPLIHQGKHQAAMLKLHTK